jgi:hypothetical protein
MLGAAYALSTVGETMAWRNSGGKILSTIKKWVI